MTESGSAACRRVSDCSRRIIRNWFQQTRINNRRLPVVGCPPLVASDYDPAPRRKLLAAALGKAKSQEAARGRVHARFSRARGYPRALFIGSHYTFIGYFQLTPATCLRLRSRGQFASERPRQESLNRLTEKWLVSCRNRDSWMTSFYLQRLDNDHRGVNQIIVTSTSNRSTYQSRIRTPNCPSINHLVHFIRHLAVAPFNAISSEPLRSTDSVHYFRTMKFHRKILAIETLPLAPTRVPGQLGMS